MAEKYLVESHISANPQSWFGIENVFRKKNNCSCLYISFFENELHLWILKTTEVLYYKRISLEENLVQAGLPKDLPLSQFLADYFRSLARLRLMEKHEEDGVVSSLSLCYKLFIAPIYDLLEEPEVIIVPDRSLYKVPFAALSEKEGVQHLSETHRIRVIPSLTILKY
ncbi:unnamed protein product [Pocillopora meandrina]|uniref:CHAT domain-containing protein n=1 Tax=Pocillopora meandrina TaxID=46732 RepID=A0AAU9WF10_9CNID|nr:unnamed protein product [Pocillopora meandrina]